MNPADGNSDGHRQGGQHEPDEDSSAPPGPHPPTPVSRLVIEMCATCKFLKAREAEELTIYFRGNHPELGTLHPLISQCHICGTSHMISLAKGM
jgi:hypothetical protein